MVDATASRRAWLWACLASAAGAHAAPPPTEVPDPIRRGRPLVFPRDHGAHTGARIEWWYLTGSLWPAAHTEAEAQTRGGLLGFQITFFRLKTGLAAADALPGRFAARQLLMAHAALTDVAEASHQHGQRLQRWNGADDAPPLAGAQRDDAAVNVGRWRLWREVEDRWITEVDVPEAMHPRARAPGFALRCTLTPTQPLLLQGAAGFSRKGPREEEASHYYSVPHLQAEGTLWRGAAVGSRLLETGQAVRGRVWLDHEWSDTLLAPNAAGWDWVGLHGWDGSALTAFRLRDRTPGATPVWAGGSWRASARAAVRDFAPQEVRFEPLAEWVSPRTGARYPVRWRLHTPAGTHEIHALLDGQELDGAASTGTIYWEGLAEWRDAASGRVLGRGYLEMTGYVGRFSVGS